MPVLRLRDSGNSDRCVGLFIQSHLGRMHHEQTGHWRCNERWINYAFRDPTLYFIDKILTQTGVKGLCYEDPPYIIIPLKLIVSMSKELKSFLIGFATKFRHFRHQFRSSTKE